MAGTSGEGVEGTGVGVAGTGVGVTGTGVGVAGSGAGVSGAGVAGVGVEGAAVGLGVGVALASAVLPDSFEVSTLSVSVPGPTAYTLPVAG